MCIRDSQYYEHQMDMADLALEQQKAKQRMNALERKEGANYVDAGS